MPNHCSGLNGAGWGGSEAWGAGADRDRVARGMVPGRGVVEGRGDAAGRSGLALVAPWGGCNWLHDFPAGGLNVGRVFIKWVLSVSIDAVL